MTSQTSPTCTEHHTAKEWRATTFEYQEEGISVRVPNVYAWVCPEDGEASFTPETTDEIITTCENSWSQRSEPEIAARY